MPGSAIPLWRQNRAPRNPWVRSDNISVWRLRPGRRGAAIGWRIAPVVRFLCVICGGGRADRPRYSKRGMSASPMGPWCVIPQGRGSRACARNRRPPLRNRMRARARPPPPPPRLALFLSPFCRRCQHLRLRLPRCAVGGDQRPRALDEAPPHAAPTRRGLHIARHLLCDIRLQSR